MMTITNAVKTKASKTIAFLAGWKKEISETLVAVFEFQVKVITLRGQMRGTDEDVTILYVGRGLNLPHITKKYFLDAKTIETTKANLLTFRTHMKTAEANADVVFVDVGWPYNGRINKDNEYLELPDWVTMQAPIKEDWDSTVQNFRKTMRKNIKRLIRKNGYTCELTNDPEIINNFYDDFYAPFINSRHAGEVFLTSPRFIKNCAQEGTILRVIGPDGPVAAGVYHKVGDVLRFVDGGMPAQYIEKPAEASIAAMYYFSMLYAFDNSCTAVNFMGTRPFPTDGLFQFKRKWGAAVTDDFSDDSILFKPMNNSAKAAHFCELFPFIARKGDKLEMVISARDANLDQAARNRVIADYHCDGIDHVKIVHVAGQSETHQSPDQPPITVIGAELDRFAQAFTGKTDAVKDAPVIGTAANA